MGLESDMNLALISFEGGIASLLSQRGIDGKSVLATEHSIGLELRYDEMVVRELPMPLRGWLQERYAPRRVELDRLYIDCSRVRDDKFQLTKQHQYNVFLEVASYHENTEEDWVSRRREVAIPDKEIFDLPVLHSVREIEQQHDYRGVVDPDNHRVIFNHLDILLKDPPYIWSQTTQDISNWILGKGDYGQITGNLPPHILALLGQILPDPKIPAEDFERKMRQPQKTVIIY